MSIKTNIRTDSQSCFERLFEVTACNTQSELAQLLNIKQSAISDAKKRGAIPFAWLGKLASFYGVNPNWIVHGLEPKFINQGSQLAFDILSCFPEQYLAIELRRRKSI